MGLEGKITTLELTDTGRVRDHNEDAVATDIGVGLLVLADGMGGYSAGEVASEIAMKTVIQMVQERVKQEDRVDIDFETGLTRQSIVLRDAILRANKVIHQTAQTRPQCEGMGTTVVTCLFWDNRVSIAHVGDSRMYRFRDGRFTQLTRDHSLLQELVSRGFYSREEAERSLNRNYVTRALGVESTVEVEIQEETVHPGDVYVLCSDGLSDMVRDQDIHLTISTFSASLEEMGQQLLQLANDNGGRDNISMILAHVTKPFAAPKQGGLMNKIAGWARLN